MLNIWKQKPTAFGLDISEVSIKAMQLERRSKSCKILGYTEYNLPKGVIVNDVIQNDQVLANHIKNMMVRLNYGKIKATHVVASIPESKAFVRVLQIPKMTEEQAANAVPVEAEQYIPIPLDQAYLDWQIIGEKEEKLDVLVTASPKEFVDSYLRVLKLAGMKVIAFEVESSACARALITPDLKSKNVLIVDMSSARTSLIVAEKGNLQFTSSVPIAGDLLTNSLSSALNLNFQEAEKVKIEVGLDDSKEHQNVKTALSKVIDGLVVEIRNIIKFHDEHNADPITQIVLCGGTSRLQHLTSYLYQQLADLDHIDIILANPWVNIFDPRQKIDAPISREDSLSYTTVIGLATRALEVK